MQEQEKELVTINQLVEKKVYSKIKILAAMDDKKIQDVVTDAFIYYAQMRGLK
jgi:hypothetical protein